MITSHILFLILPFVYDSVWGHYILDSLYVDKKVVHVFDLVRVQKLCIVYFYFLHNVADKLWCINIFWSVYYLLNITSNFDISGPSGQYICKFIYMLCCPGLHL